MTLNFTEGR